MKIATARTIRMFSVAGVANACDKHVELQLI